MPSASTSSTRILDSAVLLFATRGYDATSVREICEAAHITKPTLYHFFRSKDGVFRAIVGTTLDRMHEDIKAALQAHAGLDDRLREVVRRAFRAAGEQPRLWRFVFGTVWCPTRAPIEEMHRRYEAMTATLGAALEEGIVRGDIAPGPTPIRLLTLMGTVSEALSSYLILGRPDLTNELADAIVESVVHGWRCPPVPSLAGPLPDVVNTSGPTP